MSCRIMELQSKEVVCIKNGVCLGRVCDVEVDTHSGKLCAIVVYGKLKFFGLFGREDDIIIKWDDIEVIGEDTILIDFDPPNRRKRRKFFSRLFG